ncbi:hypothetical protein D6853_09805 [Butyrivibrio sp. X503]|uniref:hypothetical protein n=1 Tax=Butyrivibrio sp. X503 TaxID=2364878 RepID=UPI000EA920A6|nr:hypothetical protein [Butyrivibrio sp. X503]RKM55831.1 hypothetical protein D6853_09805 [Butyrivibrio sp. X503]
MTFKLDDKVLKRLHFIILIAWLIPIIISVPPIGIPFSVTVVILLIDIIKSKGYQPYNKMMPYVIGLNILGMVISTLLYELLYYSFRQDPNFGPGMGIIFAGVWDIIYLVLLAWVIGIGYLILFIRSKLHE